MLHESFFFEDKRWENVVFVVDMAVDYAEVELVPVFVAVGVLPSGVFFQLAVDLD